MKKVFFIGGGILAFAITLAVGMYLGYRPIEKVEENPDHRPLLRDWGWGDAHIPSREYAKPALRLKKEVKPLYPKEAIRKGIEGQVTIRMTVNRYGTVTRAVKEGGDNIFALAAIVAVQEFEFKPLRGYDPTSLDNYSMTFRFSLRPKKIVSSFEEWSEGDMKK